MWRRSSGREPGLPIRLGAWHSWSATCCPERHSLSPEHACLLSAVSSVTCQPSQVLVARFGWEFWGRGRLVKTRKNKSQYYFNRKRVYGSRGRRVLIKSQLQVCSSQQSWSSDIERLPGISCCNPAGQWSSCCSYNSGSCASCRIWTHKQECRVAESIVY